MILLSSTKADKFGMLKVFLKKKTNQKTTKTAEVFLQCSTVTNWQNRNDSKVILLTMSLIKYLFPLISLPPVIIVRLNHALSMQI